MKSTLGGAAVGLLLGALVLLLGVLPAIAIALALAGVAIVSGAIDYVRTH